MLLAKHGFLILSVMKTFRTPLAFVWPGLPRDSLSLAGNRPISSSSALGMVQNRGLEIRRESATPTEGGMMLYVKAGPDGKTLGDCPFAHFVGMVLHEKNLEYDLIPCTQETKPNWLIDFYEGKMPALRHRQECYTESSVIAEYLDFFFPDPPMKSELPDGGDDDDNPTAGFFPAVAQYLKNTEEGEVEEEKLDRLNQVLTKLDNHLAQTAEAHANPQTNLEKPGQVSLRDCTLAPQLYHLSVGIKEFKSNIPNIAEDYPAVQAYMDNIFARPSFIKTVYPPETVIWGWGNARSK